MKYLLLGNSGLRVSELCLGTMTFGTEWGFGASYEESKRQFDLFANAGGNFIDTANRYTEGVSEKYVGDFIQQDRGHFVVATKYTLFEQKDSINQAGNHRKNMVQTVEQSLKRLKTDYLDVLYVHMWDFTTPEQEVMRSLEYLVQQGKVLHIAVSDTPAWVVAKCNTLAELRGWSSFVGLQVEYSLIQRTPERDLLPMAKAFNLPILAWAPLAGGALTGKFLKNPEAEGRTKPESARRNERATQITELVVDIARRKETSPTHIALSWLRQNTQPVIPIVGARNTTQLADSLGCVTVDLSPDEMAELDAISAIELGFPHDFLQQPLVNQLVFNGMKDKIK